MIRSMFGYLTLLDFGLLDASAQQSEGKANR